MSIEVFVRAQYGENIICIVTNIGGGLFLVERDALELLRKLEAVLITKREADIE